MMAFYWLEGPLQQSLGDLFSQFWYLEVFNSVFGY